MGDGEIGKPVLKDKGLNLARVGARVFPAMTWPIPRRRKDNGAVSRQK